MALSAVDTGIARALDALNGSVREIGIAGSYGTWGATSKQMIRDEAIKYSIRTHVLGPDEIVSGRMAGGFTPTDMDVIILRDGAEMPERALHGVATLERNGMPVVNSPHVVRGAANKIDTADALRGANVDHPATRIISSGEDLDQAIEMLGMPLVIKLPRGTQGFGVNITKSESQARQLVDTIDAVHNNVNFIQQLPSRPAYDDRLLAQEFMPLAGGDDIRAFVVRGEHGEHEVVASMLRSSNGGERSNLHQGGTATPIDLTREQADLATAAARAMDLDVAGVDLLPDERTASGLTVVETNSGPGFKIADVTGVPVHKYVLLEALLAAQRGASHVS